MALQQILLFPSDELGWSELRTILTALRSVRIIGEATSLEQAASMAAGTPPDVIFSALVINDTSLLPLLTDLRQHVPGTTIAVCASSFAIQELQFLGELGVNGYLVWTDFSRHKLRQAIVALLNGVVVGSETVAALVSAALGGQRERSEFAASLTPRERAVLAGLTAGHTREEIAIAEGATLRTIGRTIVALQEKLDAPSLFLLGMRAAERGLTP